MRPDDTEMHDPTERGHQMPTEIDVPTGELRECRVALTEDRWVRVTAQPTACEQLVITPEVWLPDNRTPTFTGKLTLVHTLSGATLLTGSSAARLTDLAGRLAPFDWTFTDHRAFAALPSETRDAIRKIVRQWRIDEADTSPVTFYRDDEAASQARQSAPAHTLLGELLDWWQNHFDRTLARLPSAEPTPAEMQARAESYAASGDGYGLIYLLAILQQLDPLVADIAARNLMRDWDSGDGLGERIHQWRTEFAARRPLTVYGFPDHRDLQAFADAWVQDGRLGATADGSPITPMDRLRLAGEHPSRIFAAGATVAQSHWPHR